VGLEIGLEVGLATGKGVGGKESNYKQLALFIIINLLDIYH
jgi:hypothetical protein